MSLVLKTWKRGVGHHAKELEMRRWIILLVAALCLVGCEAGFVQLDIPRHPELLGNKNESSDKDNGSYVSHVRCYVTSAPYHTIIKWYEKELKIGSKNTLEQGAQGPLHDR